MDVPPSFARPARASSHQTRKRPLKSKPIGTNLKHLIKTGTEAAVVAIALFVPFFWAPGIILALTGAYLLVWATLGKARWCRDCKKFSVAG